jgi:SAM-dependent methyltransferase
MAHLAQQNFFNSLKSVFPERFRNCRVLDIGSLDINGNNRSLFTDADYIGIDLGKGPNVDVVSYGHEYKSDVLFDVIISSECFEHDMYYAETLKNAVSLLKPGGLFTFTCATTGREEHGTKRSFSEWASPFTSKLFDGYYKNLTESDIRNAIDVDNIFSSYEFIINPIGHDLYFYGIKKV